MPTPEEMQLAETPILPWANETVAKLRLQLADLPKDAPEAEERIWKLKSELLSDFSRNSSRLVDHLTEQGAMIYENHGVRVQAQMRGYYFESISRAIPLNHPLCVTFIPSELREEDPDDIDQFRRNLDKFTQKTVYELKSERGENKLAWDKGALISQEISQRLKDDLAARQDKAVVYIPALDHKYKLKNELLNQDKVLIRFEPKVGKWITEARVIAKAQAHQDLANHANQLNQELNQAWTLPDAVILDGDRPVGIIETKCWQTEEVAALVQLLKEMPMAAAGETDPEKIYEQRQVQGDEQERYQTQSFNLFLKLKEEVTFVEKATGEKLEKPLLVLRFPANIPPDEVEDLQDLLHAQGYNNVLIQQLLINANEVEIIATEYLHSREFIEALETRFAELKTAPQKPGQIAFSRNVKARLLSMKLTLETLKDFILPPEPTWEDHSKNRLKADAEKYQIL